VRPRTIHKMAQASGLGSSVLRMGGRVRPFLRLIEPLVALENDKESVSSTTGMPHENHF